MVFYNGENAGMKQLVVTICRVEASRDGMHSANMIAMVSGHIALPLGRSPTDAAKKRPPKDLEQSN